MRRLVKDARDLRTAALAVAVGSQNRSCFAIDAVRGAVQHSTLRGRYASFMLGGLENPYDMEWPGGPDSKEAQEVRIMLLLFAAEASLTGDLRRSFKKTFDGRACKHHPELYGLRYSGSSKPCIACADDYYDAWIAKNRKYARKKIIEWRERQGPELIRIMNADIARRHRRLNAGKYPTV